MVAASSLAGKNILLICGIYGDGAEYKPALMHISARPKTDKKPAMYTLYLGTYIQHIQIHLA
jgi:hypothetical protein